MAPTPHTLTFSCIRQLTTLNSSCILQICHPSCGACKHNCRAPAVCEYLEILRTFLLMWPVTEEESQRYYGLNLCPFSLHILKLYALMKWHLEVIRPSWQTSHMRSVSSVEAFSPGTSFISLLGEDTSKEPFVYKPRRPH